MSLLQTDEHTSLEALAKGDYRGLNWLFDQHKKSVFHFCMKLLKNQDLAEEATADVFITIWKKRHLIDTTHAISPFLYKVARDTAYSYLRKVASNERLKARFLETYQTADHEDGEWLYLKKEHAEKVADIVGTLPAQRQLIFRMRYFDGKDNPTIAEELHLSIHTVKSQLGKARNYVRQELGILGPSNVYVLLALLMMGES
ncbi:MAG: sigma-70 family RNA polymerase sigma factor [Bacteroidota bacterium]